MKVLTIFGSPRKKSNTAKVLGWVEDCLLQERNEVKRLTLAAMDVKPCLACAVCKKSPDVPGCVLSDDGIGPIEDMLTSDVVLLAAPLYMWGFPAQIKAAIDRAYCLVTGYHTPAHNSLMQGKTFGLVMTGASPYENNAEPAVSAYRTWASYLQCANAGELYLGSCSTPDKLGATERVSAEEFAGRLVATR
jgi:multimeric flavodoxin WrbA